MKRIQKNVSFWVASIIKIFYKGDLLFLNIKLFWKKLPKKVKAL